MITDRNDSEIPLLEQLTRREQEVLELLVEGLTGSEMAERLTLAVSSVRWYVQQIYGKLGVNSKRQAIRRARALGLLRSGVSILAAISGPDTVEASLPTGTVTFLFTDIEGSTPLWESRPQPMAKAIQVHHAALRQTIEANGGVVFKTVGDAFQAAFDTAPQALQAAIAGQRALQSAAWNALGPLKVRMGLHTGEAVLDPGGDEYAVSHTKNRVARILSAAHGGQVLLSQECADLVRRSLPEGVTLEDMGEHSLKGMSFLEHLYQACVPGLPQEFPTLASGITHSHNLPAQLTSFIGREAEITALRQMITTGPTRLVTLTGSGGVGKTRLALRAAEEMLDDFVDGVWLVELAPLDDPTLVAQAAVTVCGLLQTPGQSATQVLCENLRNKRLLLILDNCEHLLNAAAELADKLLRACPHLHILATSREILGVSGETHFRCPSLSLPDPQHLPPAAESTQSEAVCLFVQRAQTTSPGFSMTEANAALIAQVCRRLDGIPLAIELAAARVRLLSMEQIASRLEADFRLLTGGSRTALPRQQTLKALIDWSYNLLSEKERRLLLRLSVFAGGWTLEAAENVCCDQGEGCLAREEILDLLGQLVDKSLVILGVETSGDAPLEHPRYRMLETIRQYAHEKMVDNQPVKDADEAAVRQRHLDYILWLALQAEPHLRGKGQREWLDRLEVELDNIRLALEWSFSNDIEKGLQLATALNIFWHIRNHWIDGDGWLDRLLVAEVSAVTDADPSMDTEKSGNQSQHLARSIVRGKALNVSGGIKINWSDNEKAVPLLKEALAIFQALGDLSRTDLANSLGNLAFIEKDLDLAIAGVLQALDLLRKEGDSYFITLNLEQLAHLNIANGDFVQARANIEECLAWCREVEDLDGEAGLLADLGLLELLSGNPLQAELLIRKAQYIMDALGDRVYSATMINLLAYMAMSEGNYLQAIQCSEAALDIAIEIDSKVMIMNTTSFLGWEAWALGDYDQAIQQCEKGVALARELRPNLAIMAEYILGRVALSRGEYIQAYAHFKALLIALEVKDEPLRINFIWSPYGFKGIHFPTFEAINALGVLAAAQHQAERAAILFSAQDALSPWLKNILSLAECNEYEQALASARAALGEKAFSSAWEEGQAMKLEQAVAYALDEHE